MLRLIILLFAAAVGLAAAELKLDEFEYNECFYWKHEEKVTHLAQKMQKCMEGAITVDIARRFNDPGSLTEAKSLYKDICRRAPKIKHCALNFIENVQLCYNVSQKAHFESLRERFNNLTDFICEDKGMRIAKFVFYKGPECLARIKDDALECMRDVVMPHSEMFMKLDLDTILTYVPECKITNKVIGCLALHSKKCDSPRITKFIRLVTQYMAVCKD